MNLLNNAMSGLNASMAALQVMSNNTSNAMVPGYSRQQVLLSSVGGGAYGAGNGVSVDGVRRISDQYQVMQLWRTGSDVGFAGVKQSYAGQLEQLMAADSNNLSTGLDHLFAAMNAAMEKPNDPALRQAVLNEANGVAQRFNSIASGLDSQEQQIVGQTQASIKEINTLLEKIARLNEDIAADGAAKVPSASLLDNRDAAIAELSSLIDIRVVMDDKGLANISLSQGQPLLSGIVPATLKGVTDPANPKQINLELSFGQSQFKLQETGGQLGALFNYRDTNLKQSRAFLDELATQLAQQMNDIQAKGTDLAGNKATQAIWHLDASNPAGSLRLNQGLNSGDLAFGLDGTPGDNSNLKAFVALANQELDFASMGSRATLGNAYASKVGELGSISRQAQQESKTALALQKEAQSQWASTSGINLDEEGVNLIVYQQSYQANARVIATADRLFQSLLDSI
ncbi:flagellar hook-associated protein FlgK [Shewanella algae]|uniref:flagellar hook-associated protein FlgK n=1 Tax=Shewanella algae TaxID=38313 RepID=UPI0030070420